MSFIILEYASNGSLFNHLVSTGKFGEKLARSYFKKLLSAIETVHNAGYSHRDIKPENILFDDRFELKLADFGLASKSKVSTSKKGTICYMAPEILAGMKYNTDQADVYACAIVLFVMITGNLPFIRADMADSNYACLMGDNSDEFWKNHEAGYGSTFSKEFKSLFKHMVAIKADRRSGLSEIKKSKWYNGETLADSELQKIMSVKKSKYGNKINTKVNEQAQKGCQDQDIYEASSISTANNVSKSTASDEDKPLVKYTKYFNVAGDGDVLIDALEKFAIQHNFRYKICDEYFRVIIKIKKGAKFSLLQANVLKRPNTEMRCIECIKLQGAESVFSQTFGDLKEYLSSNQAAIESPK
jgi:serine/threonine protein kinase